MLVCGLIPALAAAVAAAAAARRTRQLKQPNQIPSGWDALESLLKERMLEEQQA
jgi:hypothetical protein